MSRHLTGYEYYDDVLRMAWDTDVPVVIVPVVQDGERALFDGAYNGDNQWQELVMKAEPEQLAIALCIRAYEQADMDAAAIPQHAGS